MTREEAIEVVRKSWPISRNMDLREALEVLLPELKESEEERIRKELISHFEAIKFVNNQDMFHGFKIDNILAYLEKQKEQKPTDYPYLSGWRKNRDDNKPELKRSVLMLTTHGVAEGEWLGEKWCQYRWSCKLKDGEVLYWMHLSDLERLEKEGEEKQKEPHYTKRNALFDKCVENCDPEIMKRVSDEIDSQLQKEQKPEWSEEDNIGWDEAFACVTRAEKAAKNEEELQNAVTAEKWLKEIKFKYCVHPVKQEWSEEDEKIRNLAIEWAETMSDQLSFVGMDPTDFRKIITWLKSLHLS